MDWSDPDHNVMRRVTREVGRHRRLTPMARVVPSQALVSLIEGERMEP